MLTDKQYNVDIKVDSNFVDDLSNLSTNLFMYSYTVTITNNSDSPIQLLDRHWEIFDSLGNKRIIEGAGVIGEQPVIKPGEFYSYSSGCDLYSDYGTMKGFYTFLDTSKDIIFESEIPIFELTTSEKLN